VSIKIALPDDKNKEKKRDGLEFYGRVRESADTVATPFFCGVAFFPESFAPCSFLLLGSEAPSVLSFFSLSIPSLVIVCFVQGAIDADDCAVPFLGEWISLLCFSIL
jgi:hypothetical protein